MSLCSFYNSHAINYNIYLIFSPLKINILPFQEECISLTTHTIVFFISYIFVCFHILGGLSDMWRDSPTSSQG